MTLPAWHLGRRRVRLGYRSLVVALGVALVVDAGGRTVFWGRVGRRTGGWNGRYRAVHRIDLSGLRRPGRYRIVVDGLAARSPAFRVATRRALFRKPVTDTVRFFQVQRDGARVPRRLDRRPFHLTDRHATVYATPVLEGDGGDVPAAPAAPWPPRPDTACGGWTRSGTRVTGSCTPRWRRPTTAGGPGPCCTRRPRRSPPAASGSQSPPGCTGTSPATAPTTSPPSTAPDARFLDGVRAWPSVEPAIDFTSTGMLAFALTARHLAAPQLRPERWR